MSWLKKTVSAEKKPVDSGLEVEVMATIEIRGICLTARANADIVGNRQFPDREAERETRDRYLSVRTRCVVAAMNLSDSFYRDTALHFAYSLCKRANDDSTARWILGQIETDMIRGAIADGRPALFD